MSARHKRRVSDSINFSIGAKLITIISIIVLLSLGSITVLVSWLVQSDLRTSAEDSNFDLNRISAMEAESMISNMRSNSRILIQNNLSLASQVTPQTNRLIEQSTAFFFAENPQVAAVYSLISGKPEPELLVNSNFFRSREISNGRVLADTYFSGQRETFSRAVRGETLMKNASPHFSRPLMALFFPWEGGGVGAVLFSSESLNENFGLGVNKSFMINNDGDILAHAEIALLTAGTNISNLQFIRTIIASSDITKQQLLEANFGILKTSSSGKTGIFAGSIFGIAADKISELIPFKSKAEDTNIIRQFVAYKKISSSGTIVITTIEFDKVFEGIYATTRRNIYLTISVLSISIIFIWFFSKTISIPLRALADAAHQIEGGVFDLELQSKSKDEIGILTNSFQKMCSALHIFGRFTNKDIAVKAMRGEIKPGGLPKHGTVFFSDIREFTAKSEGFTKYYGAEASDKIVHWLNSYFTEMVDCVEKTNGVVDKFIGDAVMAHWGTAYSAGSPRKDAFNCVKAALMMRKALYFLNKSRRPDDPSFPFIRIGCGINTGIVTAGQLGSDMRMEYTVIGDPVNLASRIEALTKPLGADILISEDTWKLVGDSFICEEMPSVTVKGKVKPVRIFAVVNFSGETKGPKTLNDVRALLGIGPPEADIDINADEKKYKIGEAAAKGK